MAPGPPRLSTPPAADPQPSNGGTGASVAQQPEPSENCHTPTGADASRMTRGNTNLVCPGFRAVNLLDLGRCWRDGVRIRPT